MYQSASSAVSLATAGSDRGHARATHSTQLVREPVSLPGRHRVRSGSPCQKKPGSRSGGGAQRLPSCSVQRSHVRVRLCAGVDLKGAMYWVNRSLHGYQEREYVYIMVRVCSCVSPSRRAPSSQREKICERLSAGEEQLSSLSVRQHYFCGNVSSHGGDSGHEYSRPPTHSFFHFKYKEE